MRAPRANLQRGGDIDMDSAMTPMIDVVFLLLVFFVWTASFQVVEQVLPSTLTVQQGTDPVNLADPPPEKDLEDVVIAIGFDTEPSWTLNGQPVASVQEIQQRLTSIARVEAAATVILHPAPQVPLEYVIETYDAARLTGFTKVSFAVNPRR